MSGVLYCRFGADVTCLLLVTLATDCLRYLRLLELTAVPVGLLSWLGIY